MCEHRPGRLKPDREEARMTADNHEPGQAAAASGPPPHQPDSPGSGAQAAPARARASVPPPNRAGGSVYGTPVSRPAEPSSGAPTAGDDDPPRLGPFPPAGPVAPPGPGGPAGG